MRETSEVFLLVGAMGAYPMDAVVRIPSLQVEFQRAVLTSSLGVVIQAGLDHASNGNEGVLHIHIVLCTRLHKEDVEVLGKGLSLVHRDNLRAYTCLHTHTLHTQRVPGRHNDRTGWKVSYPIGQITLVANQNLVHILGGMLFNVAHPLSHVCDTQHNIKKESVIFRRQKHATLHAHSPTEPQEIAAMRQVHAHPPREKGEVECTRAVVLERTISSTHEQNHMHTRKNTHPNQHTAQSTKGTRPTTASAERHTHTHTAQHSTAQHSTAQAAAETWWGELNW